MDTAEDPRFRDVAAGDDDRPAAAGGREDREPASAAEGGRGPRGSVVALGDDRPDVPEAAWTETRNVLSGYLS